jgi:hypothetical protein
MKYQMLMNSRKNSLKSLLSNKVIASGLILAASVGCATGQRAGSDQSGSPRTVNEILSRADSEVLRVEPGQEDAEIVVRGIQLKNTKFDIPITVNSAVEQWIDYFSGKGRPHFERYLERSKYFIPYIQPILRENKMPEDLVYLAMIESGFNNLARSHAKAVGPWQFMSFTGKKYGLMVNWWVDERRDIQKSTMAAIGYLRDLRSMFGSWEVAAAAYNAGEGKLSRAIQRYGSADFWVLARGRYLKSETRNYVPKMIAAALIAKNREQFGFPPAEEEKHPGNDEAVAGDGEIVKVIKTDKPEQDMDRDDAEGMAAEEAMAQAEAADNEESDEVGGAPVSPAALSARTEDKEKGGAMPLARPVLTPHANKQGEVGGAELAEFEVQSPADLLKIARAAGLSYHTVKALNPELLRWVTPPTVSTYRIKLPVDSKDKFLATYNHEAYPRKVQFMAYKVSRGQTLQNIARHFGIKVDPITDLNGISPRLPLQKGARVLLPIPNDRSRSLASLEVRDPPEGRRRVRRGSSRKKGVRYYKITYKKRESARSIRKDKRT